jgi:NADH-quinone oxidoreductase subunit J
VTRTPLGEAVIFWLLAPVTVLAAFGMLAVRKAVHSAILLAVVMISLAVFFGIQGGTFLAVVQVVVYTGAIMMLFLFVLMLVGVDSSDSLVETIRGQRIAAVLAGAGFGLLLILGLGNAAVTAFAGVAQANEGGNVPALARLIFTRYVFAFELTSALLIVAALGAMVLAHRERIGARRTQQELSQERFRAGGPMTPLPTPGVYARHNAVDTPALLPDGTAAEISVPRVLATRGDVRPAPRIMPEEPGAIVPAEEAAAPDDREAIREASTRESSQLGKGPTP